MRVLSCNINGIRSAGKKGFFEWVKRQRTDFICLQEVRAFPEQFPDSLTSWKSKTVFSKPALKPGYSGVAIITAHQPDRVITECGDSRFDDEGRYLELRYKDFSIVSAYFPSGTSGTSRQDLKMDFLAHFRKLAHEASAKGRKMIYTGDFNIAHQKRDIKNWRGNQKNSGFLPEERAWVDEFVTKAGFVDAFRKINQKEGEYTWWSNRGNARANNTGWRIDYQMVSEALKEEIKKAWVYRDQFFSDHAPVIVDYKKHFF